MSITQHLRDVVNDELFIADAESQLTPEQQKGVFAILRDMQEFTIAEKGGGTRKAAETKVLEEEGRTLDEYLRDRKDKAFIQTSLLRKIAPRVIVSWRDVEREYRHRYVEFNPPQTVTLARISVPTDEGPEQINEIESRLSSGESFADVAESLGIPDGGRLSPKTMGPGGISDISFDDAIKAQVARLQPGQHSPPFQMGDSTWWIAVVSIDTPPHRDIHDADVQRMLTDSIHRERELAEIERYAAMLRQRWVADDLEAMRLRLLAIANDRYLR